MKRTSSALIPVLLLTGACGGSADADGPLVADGDSGTTCVATTQSPSFTVGVDAIRNTGSGTVTIRDIALVEPDGLDVIEAMVLPLAVPDGTGATMTLTGVSTAYPPVDADAVAEWAEREPAAGTRINAGSSRAIVLGVASKGSGSAVGIAITYTDDQGTEFVTRTENRIEAAPSCAG